MSLFTAYFASPKITLTLNSSDYNVFSLFIFSLQQKPAKFRLQRRTTSRLLAPSQCQRITRCWYLKVLHYSAIVRRRDSSPSTDRVAFMSRLASVDRRLCSRHHRCGASHRKLHSRRCIKLIYRACHRTNPQRRSLSRSGHV